jgi:hypothetical protein
MEQSASYCLGAEPVVVDAGSPGNPASHDPHHSPGRQGEHVAPRSRRLSTLLWGISGGTILSAVGFVALALFEQYNDSINELQRDLKHFNEVSADHVKKEDLRHRMSNVMEALKVLHATDANLTKELHGANLAATARDARLIQLEQEMKRMEDERRDLVKELQRLRERLAMVEGRQAAISSTLPSKKAEE